MNELSNCLSLFEKSFFFALKKDEKLNTDLEQLQAKIIYSDVVNSFHPKRKNEFILGRICASKAYASCMNGTELLSLPSNKDRSPCWPLGIIGSITHDQLWVGAAVAKNSDLLAIGIDLEMKGRTKLRLASHIRGPADMLSHPQLSDEELLTLIFSCKESLYKALYPSVKKYFGFKDAALRSIDLQRGVFTIDLLTSLNENFGPSSRHSFNGRFMMNDQTCLTVLEIIL